MKRAHILLAEDDPINRPVASSFRYAFSASRIIDSREKVLESGMNDFTGKPIRREELYNKLNNTL